MKDKKEKFFELFHLRVALHDQVIEDDMIQKLEESKEARKIIFCLRRGAF